MMIAGDKVLIAAAGRLTVLNRTDGKTLGQVELRTDSAPLGDGIAVAEGRIFFVTVAGEVICLAGR